MQLFGLTRPSRRPSFSPRQALLTFIVMLAVTAASRVALHAWTNLSQRWTVVISFFVGYVVAYLTVGGPFTDRR